MSTLCACSGAGPAPARGGLDAARFVGQRTADRSLLYVSDHDNNRVAIFRAGGRTPVRFVGSLAVTAPFALWVDSAQHIFVAENGGTANAVVLGFPRDASQPYVSLTPSNGVAGTSGAICGDGSGTLYVEALTSGNIDIFAPGATSPTGELAVPAAASAQDGYFNGCTVDDSGNLFVTYGSNAGGVPAYLVEFKAGETSPTMLIDGLTNTYAEQPVLDYEGNLIFAAANGDLLIAAPPYTAKTGAFAVPGNIFGFAFASDHALWTVNGPGDTVERRYPKGKQLRSIPSDGLGSTLYGPAIPPAATTARI
jgi:sugar lactone lactonase YvrE